ncbi:MAG: hypothetical protein ACI8RD_005861 [Bacillariaceae sp.]|jgi:hypothetical protein
MNVVGAKKAPAPEKSAIGGKGKSKDILDLCFGEQVPVHQKLESVTQELRIFVLISKAILS